MKKPDKWWPLYHQITTETVTQKRAGGPEGYMGRWSELYGRLAGGPRQPEEGPEAVQEQGLQKESQAHRWILHKRHSGLQVILCRPTRLFPNLMCMDVVFFLQICRSHGSCELLIFLVDFCPTYVPLLSWKTSMHKSWICVTHRRLVYIRICGSRRVLSHVHRSWFVIRNSYSCTKKWVLLSHRRQFTLGFV